jgi:hypothetical protein
MMAAIYLCILRGIAPGNHGWEIIDMKIDTGALAPKSGDEKPEAASSGTSPLRAAVELIALITVAWLVSVFIEPDPAGVNVARFGIKWFIYTYLMAAVVYVLVPFCFVFSVGAAINWLAFRNPKYQTAYRVAFIVAAAWTALGNYGVWYAS